MNTEYSKETAIQQFKDRREFACSIDTVGKLVQTIVHEVGTSIEDSLEMITMVPVELLRLNKSVLNIRRDADIIAFGTEISIKRISL